MKGRGFRVKDGNAEQGSILTQKMLGYSSGGAPLLITSFKGSGTTFTTGFAAKAAGIHLVDAFKNVHSMASLILRRLSRCSFGASGL